MEEHILQQDIYENLIPRRAYLLMLQVKKDIKLLENESNIQLTKDHCFLFPCNYTKQHKIPNFESFIEIGSKVATAIWQN